MGVFKEEVLVLEKFAARQSQIYDDACDYGVFLNLEDQAKLREAAQVLVKGCHYRIQAETSIAGRSTQTDIFVAWEIDEGHARGCLISLHTWTPMWDDVLDATKTLFTIDMEQRHMPQRDFESSRKLTRDFVERVVRGYHG